MAAMILDPNKYFALSPENRLTVDEWLRAHGIDKNIVSLITDEDGPIRVYYNMRDGIDTLYAVDYYEIAENDFPSGILTS